MKSLKSFCLPTVALLVVAVADSTLAQTGNVERARLMSSQAQNLPTTLANKPSLSGWKNTIPLASKLASRFITPRTWRWSIAIE